MRVYKQPETMCSNVTFEGNLLTNTHIQNYTQDLCVLYTVLGTFQ